MTDLNPPASPSDENHDPEIVERREYARVMDAVGLIILHEVVDGIPQATRGTNLDGIKNRYDISGYAEVKRDYPAITEYIDALEERIRQLRLDGRELQEAPTHKVILSAGGVAFADDQLLQPGDIVSLRLTLFPKLQRIDCEAAVVSIGDITELLSDRQHSYRVSFTVISKADAAIIDEHVHSLCKSVRPHPEP